MYRTRTAFLCLLILGLAPKVTWAQPQNGLPTLASRSGKFIELTTDLPNAEEVATLVESFDVAVPQWIEFWQLPADAVDGWKVKAFIIRDRDRFRREGLLPDHIPEFPFGYAYDDEIYVLAQKSEYYTRHLMLHEGAHSFAFHVFGNAGPTWFMEGTADLLALHSGQGSSTRIHQIPKDRHDVPYWGRFKLMGQIRERSQIPSIETVMRYAPTLTGNVEMYGWSWAAVMLLHEYPEYRPAFIEAARNASRGPEFNRMVFKSIGQKQWPILAARWRMVCEDLDYGFDWSQQRIAIAETDPAWDGQPTTIDVAANQGWQSPGFRLVPGSTLTLTPDGTVVLGNDPKPWKSGPAGVTVTYDRGRPLGQLLACLLPTAKPSGQRMSRPEMFSIDNATRLEIKRHCWLLLRVNDNVGSLDDNQGSFQVKLVAE